MSRLVGHLAIIRARAAAARAQEQEPKQDQESDQEKEAKQGMASSAPEGVVMQVIV